MRGKEIMTRDVELATPDDTIEHAAKIMASLDAGIVPVTDDDRLVGMNSDRDIAIRAVARGKGPGTRIGDVMTGEVKYCFEDQDIHEVTQNMGDIQVRRLPVMSREKRLVGIVSLGDIAFEGTGRALGRISEPGGQHTQAP